MKQKKEEGSRQAYICLTISSFYFCLPPHYKHSIQYSYRAINVTNIRTMTTILLVPTLYQFILLALSFVLTIIFLIQLLTGLSNVVFSCCCQTLTNQRPIFNLYLFHHLVVCLIRCIVICLACSFLIISNQCLSIEVLINFLLLLSTFDLLLIIVSETAHFWDSTINHKSALYSKFCLIFGMIFNYFVSILFLSLHIIMSGSNPFSIEICQVTTAKLFLYQISYDEKSSIPTMIAYVLFILIDLLTFSWIYISYRDICNLKRKRLATIFFYSLVFTKFNEHERSAMVNRSLKRLHILCLFVLSNIIVILPVLTIKVFDISLNINQRIFFIYLTSLPWLDSITFLFYRETKFNYINCFLKKTNLNENYLRQQRIGRRLSSYRDNIVGILTVEEK
jgi:hypothetical protein